MTLGHELDLRSQMANVLALTGPGAPAEHPKLYDFQKASLLLHFPKQNLQRAAIH